MLLTKSSWRSIVNIGRGTTDPEIDSVTWTKFSDHNAWSADGGTCISYKFDDQMGKITLVPSGGITCISYKFACIATLPWIALLTLSGSIDLVSSSARVTSVKFHKHHVVTRA